MSKSPGINFSQEHLMQIIFQEQVNASQSKKKSKRKKETLYITDQVLLLDDGTEINYFYWVKLNSIDMSGKDIVVSMESDKDIETTIQFSPTKTDIKQLFALIVDLLQRILLPEKFQKINKSKYYIEPSHITGQSIISILLGYYHPNNQTEIENSNILRLKLMTKNPILKMTGFKSYQALIPAIFQVLHLITFLNYLDFGETDSILEDLIKNYEIIKKINHISFGCKNKSKLSDFLNKLASDKNIECLSISSLSLNSDECQNLIDTFKNKKMTLLGFHKGSLTSKGFATFLNNTNIISNVIFLNFNGYSNLDFNSLSSKISFITILSLVKCDIDIQKAIKSIYQNNFIKLSELDLSSNIINSTFSIKENLPPQLSKLVIGNINWHNSTNLFSFLSFIFKKMNSVLKLNLYSSKLDSSNEWKNFFIKISKLDIDLSSIYSIGWDNNPIDPALFTFLEKCVNLTTLSISSFSVQNGKDNQIDSLIKYIKNSNNKKIQTFILSSDDSSKSKLKSRINEILISLSKWKSLRTLDISQNMIGDDGIKSLQNLLSANPIKLVVFDRSSPSTIKILIDFLKAIPNGCKVNFPFDDILSFLNLKKTNIVDFQELIQLSSKMIDDKNNNIINIKLDPVPNPPPKNKKLLQKPDKSPMDQQFFVFSDHEYKSDLFIPQYVKSDVYKPLEVKPRKVQKREESDSQDDESEENNPKKKKTTRKSKKGDSDESEKKKKTTRKSKKGDSDSDESEKKKKTTRKSTKDDSDSEEESVKKKNTTKKGKKEEDESESDDYDDDFSKKKKKKKTIKTKKKQHDSSEYDDSESESESYGQKKKTKKQPSNFEMRTLMPSSSRPNRKSSPKSLTGNNRNSKSKVSLYEMQTKVSRHSYLGKETKKRKNTNKFDEIDEISSSTSDEIDTRSRKTTKKQLPPPKIIDIDESDDFNDDSFENQFFSSKKKFSRKRVQQREPPPLDRSDDDDDFDDENEYDRKIRPKFKSKISIRNDDDDDDNDEKNFSPKPPDWSFPLIFVPPPDDTKEIVDDLSEKYSVGNLLRYMYQS